MSAQLVHSTLPSWPSPVQPSESMENLPPRLMFICEIILHSYLLFFMPRFSYIVHNILPPLCLSPSLSLSVSGAFSLALYTFNYIRNVRATIENGFATLAMCSASFGQLLMVLSLPPSVLSPSPFPLSIFEKLARFARVARTAISAESAHH